MLRDPLTGNLLDIGDRDPLTGELQTPGGGGGGGGTSGPPPIKATFGVENSNVPSPSLVTVARPSGPSLRMIGGAAGDSTKWYQITEAQLVANQGSLPTFLASLTPDLTLTVVTPGVAVSGSLPALDAAKALVVVPRVTSGLLIVEEVV